MCINLNFILELLSSKKIQQHKDVKTFYAFESRVDVIIQECQYKFNYTVDNQPALVADLEDGKSKAVIIFDEGLKKVQNIYTLDDNSLKISDVTLFPEILFDSFFAFDIKNMDIYEQLSCYQISPIYKYGNCVIFVGNGRLQVEYITNNIFSIENLPLFDDAEEYIIKQIKLSGSQILPFDVCRIINSYRRLRFDIINQEQYRDYPPTKW